MTTTLIRTQVEEQPRTLTEMRILVIIPAYNEEDSLGRVMRNVQNTVPYADIVVVNDGSSDATAQIAEGYGATVLTLPYNLGIGSAMQTGYLYARDAGYDIAVQVDGDGQHDPTEIAELLDALHTSDADVVIGSRYIEDRGYITPHMRRMGITILSALISLIIRQRVTDPTSGFRAINKRTIYYCAANYPFDYPEPEAVVLFRQVGLQLKEIPVTMNPRYGGQSSITPVRSVYYMIKVIMAIVITLLRVQQPITREVEHAPSDHTT